MTQVFGVDKRGRVRGVGNVCRSQVTGSSTALENLTSNEQRLSNQSPSIINLESRVEYLMEEVNVIKKSIKVTSLGGMKHLNISIHFLV